MIQLKEWIEDGITIRKTNNGYQVFTIPTQHFDITKLDELTPDRFRAEAEKQEKQQQQTYNASIGHFRSRAAPSESKSPGRFLTTLRRIAIETSPRTHPPNITVATRNRSFQVPTTISMITSEKPIRNPHSWAFSPSGLPRTASMA